MKQLLLLVCDAALGFKILIQNIKMLKYNKLMSKAEYLERKGQICVNKYNKLVN